MDFYNMPIPMDETTQTIPKPQFNRGFLVTLDGNSQEYLIVNAVWSPGEGWVYAIAPVKTLGGFVREKRLAPTTWEGKIGI